MATETKTYIVRKQIGSKDYAYMFKAGTVISEKDLLAKIKNKTILKRLVEEDKALEEVE